MAELSAIILAAGKGTRMKSPLPKVLHPVAGDPMINRVVRSVKACGADQVRAVVGYGESLLRQVLEPQEVICCKQAEQKGTADAVRSADPGSLSEHILIVNGDHPLIHPKALKELYKQFCEHSCDLLVVSANLSDPGKFGRIVRHQGEIKAIVEYKDASQEARKIQEINTGIYFVKRDSLLEFLPQVKANNQQGEFYLTDLVSLFIEEGAKVKAIEADATLAFGVNTQRELSLASKALYREKAFQLMEEGVIIIDPEATYIEESVQVGSGSILYPGCFLKGKTRIDAFCVVEPNAFIQDSQLGQSVQVRAGSYLEKVKVGDQAVLGPYARLRPETEIGSQAKVGNFVEMKKVKFGAKAKASHLAYIGDAEVGEESNIGCGVITCNYAADRKKYHTHIGKDVFVGSDSQLVAPVKIGDGVIIASGSTINKDVPPGALAIGRSRQENKLDYAKKFKGK